MNINRTQLVPASVFGKSIAAVWALACLGVLLFAVVDKDPAIIVLILLNVLCFPVGFAVTYGVAGMLIVLYKLWHITLGGGLFFDVGIWVLFVVAGYAQWLLIARLFKAKVRGTR